MEETQQI